MRKILITDRVHPLLIKGLEQDRWDVHYRPKIESGKVLNIIEDYDGLIMNSKVVVNREILDKAGKLKFIGRLGSGLETIDMTHAETLGITVFNTPEGNRNAVAEHTLGMILCLLNHINQANAQVKAFSWNRELNRGEELSGKTIGIIGFGNTGSQLAKKLKNWGLRILAYDPYEGQFERLAFVERVDLRSLQRKAEIISFHVPLTAETKNYFNSEFVRHCRKGIFVVNTSRGAVINTRDLIMSIESGDVRGACLDVLENEFPESYSRKEQEMYEKLFRFKQVLVSPHVAGWTHEALKKIAKTMLKKIRSVDLKEKKK